MVFGAIPLWNSRTVCRSDCVNCKQAARIWLQRWSLNACDRWWRIWCTFAARTSPPSGFTVSPVNTTTSPVVLISVDERVHGVDEDRWRAGGKRLPECWRVKGIDSGRLRSQGKPLFSNAAIETDVPSVPAHTFYERIRRTPSAVSITPPAFWKCPVDAYIDEESIPTQLETSGKLLSLMSRLNDDHWPDIENTHQSLETTSERISKAGRWSRGGGTHRGRHHRRL